jgi:hypothetical protein
MLLFDFYSFALQLADNLPRVTTKKKERQAAAQAKQVVGSGKRKRSSNKSRPVTAKRRHAEPSPNVVPSLPTTSVDCEQVDAVDNVFASRKQKATVIVLYPLMSDL